MRLHEDFLNGIEIRRKNSAKEMLFYVTNWRHKDVAAWFLKGAEPRVISLSDRVL
jgi:hypothetical protein